MKGSTIKRGNTWRAYWFTRDSATGKRKQHSKGGFRQLPASRRRAGPPRICLSRTTRRVDTKPLLDEVLDSALQLHHGGGSLRPHRPRAFVLHSWVCRARVSWSEPRPSLDPVLIDR